MGEHNLNRLIAHILPLSLSNDFAVACTEWQLDHIEILDDMDNCPCGQEIKERCYIHNRMTGRYTYVGNVCINRFMGIDTGTLLQGYKRIKNDPDANANLAIIEYAWERGYLTSIREYDFLKDTVRKRKLSPKQAKWKRDANLRIIQCVERQARQPKAK